MFVESSNIWFGVSSTQYETVRDLSTSLLEILRHLITVELSSTALDHAVPEPPMVWRSTTVLLKLNLYLPSKGHEAVVRCAPASGI